MLCSDKRKRPIRVKRKSELASKKVIENLKIKISLLEKIKDQI